MENKTKAPSLIMTWANMITLVGLIAIGLSVYNLITGSLWISLIFLSVAGASDFFDGLTARALDKRGKRGTSRLGEVFDPLRDKLLVVPLLIIGLEMTLVLILLELVSLFMANKASVKLGQHTVTRLSKAVTVGQFLATGFIITLPVTKIGFGLLPIAMPAFIEVWHLFALIYIFTLIRITSYANILIKN